MPPQQRLAFGLRGFICRSCSSKLPHARWQRYSTEVKKRKRPPIPKDAFDQIKLFEQGPDGNRVEFLEDDDHLPKDAELRIAMQKRIEQLEEETGLTIEELANGEEFKNRDPLEEDEEEEWEGPWIPEQEHQFAQMEQANDRLQAIIDRVGDPTKFDDMLPEEQELLRADVRRMLDEELPEVKLTPPQIPEERELEDLQRRIQEVKSAEMSTRQRLVTSDFPEESQPHIDNLQRALDQFEVQDSTQPRRVRGRRVARVAKISVEERSKILAKFYGLARKALLEESEEVPLAVWTKLWEYLTKGEPNPTHIKRLGEDMDEAGVSMQPSQRIEYIQSVFQEGLLEHALDLWEKASAIAEPVGSEYWATGVGLLSRLGHTDRAFAAAAFLFQGATDPSDFQALIPLIKACLSTKYEDSVQRSWALYIRVRANLGSIMDMEDYDDIISSFMEAGEPELALAVFRDMMLTGDRSLTNRDSLSLQKLYGGVNNLKSLDFGQNELDWRDSKVISALPPKFKNKFFFGSWVRKLIGDDQLDTAMQVLDLAMDHGIRPSPMQMNGLIGAWFRSKSASSWKMANDLAWRMIDIRAERMAYRDWRFQFESPLRAQISPESNPAFKKRSDHFPSATLETFTLLLREYRLHQKHTDLSNLFDAFRKSRIVPNTQFMNQLLLMDLRQKRKTWAWDTYCSLTNDHNVKPNSQTFLVLFNMAKRTLDPLKGPKVLSKGFPTARLMFAEMAKHQSTLSEQGEFSRELYDLVISTFSLASDQIATAIALHVFHQQFKMLPTEDTAKSILLQLTRAGFTNEAGISPRRLDLGKARTKERMGAVAEVVRMFQTRRTEALQEKGIDMSEFSEEQQMEESLSLLSDLLRYAATQMEPSAQYSIVSKARSAADTMGFPGCSPWQDSTSSQNV